MNENDSFYPAGKQQWREWLLENHHLKQSVWVIFYKKKSGVSSVSWSDAVDEALCFGWVDSKKISLGDDMYKQFFCRRKPNSTWSKVNKNKILQLIETGKMTPAGMESVEIAKRNGSWQILDEAEDLAIPGDLATELKKHEGAMEYFSQLSKSTRKGILQWLVLAKRPETRQKRISEAAGFAAQRLKPPQFR